MSESDIDRLSGNGILRPELFVGVVATVTANSLMVNLSAAGRPSGSHYQGGRYGRGEVGEFILVEGQRSILLGRIAEVRPVEAERRAISPDFAGKEKLEACARIDLLGHLSMDTLRVTAGVDAYPRLGDRVFAAPHVFIAHLPELMESKNDDKPAVTLHLGSVDGAEESAINVKPERLFGRHCAILGATGGGKSWTTARIIEECLKHKCKVILLDATGEYRGFQGKEIRHCHLGEPIEVATNSIAVSLPPTCFHESDFLALFEPSGKVQGPKLRAAIRSLRLAKLKPDLAPNGYIQKIGKSKAQVESAEREATTGSLLDDPRQPFDAAYLTHQLEEECVHPEGFRVGGRHGEKDPTIWGGASGEFTYCMSLVTRISGVLSSTAFSCVFADHQKPSVLGTLDDFLSGDARLLRICLGGLSYEYRAREVIANAFGRQVLSKSRSGSFSEMPTVLFVDEAHNFLGHHIGGEDFVAKLDAFELIAKEGRKYGLNLCLASQRPRDITEGVLSQMGTLIVHRLTNDRDREVVERACGEIDRAASAFLPNLQPGEAAIIGTDFPIPLTVRIARPDCRPKSDGPDFQTYWD